LESVDPRRASLRALIVLHNDDRAEQAP